MFSLDSFGLASLVLVPSVFVSPLSGSGGLNVVLRGMIFPPPSKPADTAIFPTSVSELEFLGASLSSSWMGSAFSVSVFPFVFSDSVKFSNSFSISSFVVSVGLSGPIVPF